MFTEICCLKVEIYYFKYDRIKFQHPTSYCSRMEKLRLGHMKEVAGCKEALHV